MSCSLYEVDIKREENGLRMPVRTNILVQLYYLKIRNMVSRCLNNLLTPIIRRIKRILLGNINILLYKLLLPGIRARANNFSALQ